MLVTRPKALCDGRWHRLAGELGPPLPSQDTPEPPSPLQSRARGALGWAQLQTPRQGTQQGTEPHAWLARCLPAGHKEAVSLVTKGGSLLRLEVDLQSNHTLGPVPAASANTLVPLHLGGLPGEWGLGLGGGGSCPPGAGCCDRTPASDPTRLPPTAEPTDAQARPPAYGGCMRNLRVNQAPVALPPTAGVQGAVGAGGCPAT